MIFVARKKNHISQKSCYAKFYYKEDVHCASEKNHPMENHIRRGIAVNILYTLQKKKVLGQLKNREKCFKICYVYGKRKPT